jgi:hypothetical protein
MNLPSEPSSSIPPATQIPSSKRPREEKTAQSFFDTITSRQKHACDLAVNEFLCENAIAPFVTESPSYERMLKTLRPAYATTAFAKAKQHLGSLLDATFLKVNDYFHCCCCCCWLVMAAAC